MRDAEIYAKFNQVNQALEAIFMHMKMGLTNEAIQLEAIKRILKEKTNMTDDDFVKALGAVVQEANAKAAEETEKPKTAELIQPTPADIAKIEQSTTPVVEQK